MNEHAHTLKKDRECGVVDDANLVYCLFDLETNGLGRNYNDIVEIFAMLTDAVGVALPGNFHSRCKPMRGVGFTSNIHGIKDEMLENKQLFC